jgi:hypothetical protein
VLDLVTRRTESNEPYEGLSLRVLVVIPAFVALDRMLATYPTTDLALVVGILVDGSAEAVPLTGRQLGAEVDPPLALRDEFNGECGLLVCRHHDLLRCLTEITAPSTHRHDRVRWDFYLSPMGVKTKVPTKDQIKAFTEYSLIWYSEQFAVPFWVVGHLHLHMTDYHADFEAFAAWGLHAMVALGFWLGFRRSRREQEGE